MFWCEKLSEADKYCICQAGWTKMKIGYTSPSNNLEYVRVFMEPEDGRKCLIFGRKKGSSATSANEFVFMAQQHIRVEVEGGVAVIFGEANAAVNKVAPTNRYQGTCPFSDDGDWIAMKATRHVPIS